MLNREKIIEILNEYNFDCDKYVVLSSSAMVLHGIKEYTRDIDISVTWDYYNYLLDNYDCVFERYDINGDKCYMMGDYINFGVTYFYGNKRIIDGLPVQDVCEIIKLKRGLNRSKDLEDLKLLMMYKKDN